MRLWLSIALASGRATGRSAAVACRIIEGCAREISAGMRIAIVFGGAALLFLGGSMLDRSSSAENVRTAYAGPASMSAQQVTQLLHNQGYTNVRGLHENGDDWVGAATTSTGTHVDFDIDKDGVIHAK